MVVFEPGARVLVGDNRQPGTVADRQPLVYVPLGTPHRYTVAMDDGTTRTELSEDDLGRPDQDGARSAAAELVRRVAFAEYVFGRFGHPLGDEPEPTLTDDLDAIAALADARRNIDYDEAGLIDAARARGATWEQIGLALGSPPRSAKQRAKSRRNRLPDGLTSQPERG